MINNPRVSIFYYIHDDKLLNESEINEFDEKMDSVMRGLINNGIHINNFQDRLSGFIQ